MPDPIGEKDQAATVLGQVAQAAQDYLARVDGLPAGGSALKDQAAGQFAGDLPEDGDGSVATLTRLLAHGVEAAVNSAGPRFFHFVTGGSTPAALASPGP